MYASYTDYTERFRGRAIRTEEDFDRLALRAGVILDRLTRGRAARFRDTEGRLALACCAVTEKLYELEERGGGSGGEVAAERVGDYRVEYRYGSRREYDAELAALAEYYLWGTGLTRQSIPVASEI